MDSDGGPSGDVARHSLVNGPTRLSRSRRGRREFTCLANHASTASFATSVSLALAVASTRRPTARVAARKLLVLISRPPFSPLSHAEFESANTPVRERKRRRSHGAGSVLLPGNGFREGRVVGRKERLREHPCEPGQQTGLVKPQFFSRFGNRQHFFGKFTRGGIQVP